MSEQDLSTELPEPVIRRRRRLDPSLVWLVPAIAVLVGLALMVRAYQTAGPEITITFQTADGLEKGKTEVRFKNVVIGKVQDIQLDESRQKVVVSVGLTRDAEGLAVEDTRFWVVRPRADLGGISGLNTLLSGAYIGVDGGTSTESQEEFTGLEVPPAITSDQRGKRFLLAADDLGSLSIGSPVYYRRVPVGRIAGYELAPNGKGVNLQMFVDSPYDRYVTQRTHFWNASGVDVKLDANGVSLSTQSLVTLLAGGVAFQQLEGPVEPAASDTQFKLYADEKTALAAPDGSAVQIRLRFMQSVRGLSVDAPVDFKGISLGTVRRIGLDFDQNKKRFTTEVAAEIYPERLGASYQRFRDTEGKGNQPPEALISRLVERGLRAQLRSGNLLTGQLYVALDFESKATPVKMDGTQSPLEIPTTTGSLDQIQTHIANIVEKLDKVPIEAIGNNLRDTLRNADHLMLRLDTELAPDAQRTLEQSERAARSLRDLGDYLQRHPEALLRGRPDTAVPAPAK